MKSRLRPASLFALMAILLTFPPAAAQRDHGYQDDAYPDDGIRQAVARISDFEGSVSFSRGDDPDDWQLASINYPMTLGDRIWTDRGARAELQLPGGTVYLGPETELAALDLTRDVRQLSLALGTASFRIRRLDREEVVEVATPNVSVTFETPGSYRVDVDADGNSRVAVYQGRAWAASVGGQVELERGERAARPRRPGAAPRDEPRSLSDARAPGDAGTGAGSARPRGETARAVGRAAASRPGGRPRRGEARSRPARHGRIEEGRAGEGQGKADAEAEAAERGPRAREGTGEEERPIIGFR